VVASLVSEDSWERDRSLALLALVSYKPRSGKDAEAGEPEVEGVEEATT
jgi:hypothetical protein